MMAFGMSNKPRARLDPQHASNIFFDAPHHVMHTKGPWKSASVTHDTQRKEANIFFKQTMRLKS